MTSETLYTTTRRILTLFVTLVVVQPPSNIPAAAEGAPPLPQRNPARLTEPAEQMPVLPGEAPAVAWTESEVTAAQAVCTKTLKDVALDYDLLDPIREGLCGAPAPILVRSVGTSPKVAIDPPATMTCTVAHALNGWLSKDVQLDAKARLGSEVVALRSASSYVCRNRNGSDAGLISEHARANALDISEFVLASGQRITVLESWPIAPDGAATEELPPSAPKPLSNPFIRTKPSSNPFVETKSAPPPKPSPVATEPEVSDETRFIRSIHEAACRRFGTVLGPEANEAHKDHFHLDMKARRHSNFCE